MKTIVNIVRGTLRLDVDLKLVGIVRGEVIVPAGRHFELLGIVTGRVVVETGASAFLKGVVLGGLDDAAAGATVKGFARRR